MKATPDTSDDLMSECGFATSLLPVPGAAGEAGLGALTADVRLAAARYHLLTRVLPVQRHDVMGRLSVLRMALMVARRKADSSQAVDGDSGAAGAWAKLEEHVRDATEDLKRLRWWDLPTEQRDPAGALLGESVRLIAAMLSLQGHRIEWTDGPVFVTGAEPDLPSPATQLAVMGLALQMADASPERRVWHVRASAESLRCDSLIQPLREGLDAAPLPPHGAVLQAWMADALAEAAACTVDRWPTGWELRWTGRRQG